MFSSFEQFLFSISCINRHVQRLERAEMVRHGYRGSFAQYLLALYHYDEGLTAAKLASLCDKDKAAISRAVTEMEEKGLVCRVRSGDRIYRARICLTEEGQRIAEHLFERAKLAVKEIGRELDREELRVICGALNRIATRLHDMVLEAPSQEEE